MNISECVVGQQTQWDDFVFAHPQGWHYHLYGWKEVIEGAYGHDCKYLLASQGQTVVGVLPLAIVRSRLFGCSATSLPFLDAAGVIANDPDVKRALIERAVALTEELHLGYLELRSTTRLDGDFRVDTHKVSLTMPLTESAEQQWESLPSERRNRVRKAMKAGLEVVRTDREGLPEFYRVWSENMRDLGSPAHSLRWFETTMSAFEDTASFILVRAGKECVGAAVMIDFKGTLAVPWVSSLRKWFAQHPNDLLYWGAMETAIQRRCRTFDFGRSTVDSGNHTYKARWGAQAGSLFWHYHGAGHAKAAKPPSEESSKFRLAVAIWKRLPLGLATWMGPHVRKGITS